MLKPYRLLATASCFVLASLGACSSGSGGGAPPVASTPTPTPAPAATPTPTPTPAPTPTPSVNYDTAEYRATVGAVSMNALAAYNKGATGLGVKVGIIDSGIDLNSPEFGNRIDPASTYVAGTGTIQDEGGHGTAVAFTLGGRRNDVGTLGVAFDATLLILRSDTAGSCASSGGCQHDDTNIAAALDVARTNGARVVNISLGGSPASSVLVNAINRATAAGIVIVISAGNDGTAEPDPLAQIAENNAVARNLVIIAGSVGTTDQLSTFSDKAGAGAAHFLSAVGEKVQAPDNHNTQFLWTGTSFSAPQISGAVALLAQAFPTLTGAQIVSILYQSARDAGATGVDPVYGQGILDLTKAFQPLGSASLSSTRAPVSLTANGTLSTPMGDARQAGLGAVILDGYGRAFATDFARTLRAASPAQPLSAALSRQRNYAAAIGGTTVAVTIAPDREGTKLARLNLSAEDGERARTIAATVTGRLGARADFAVGMTTSAPVLSAQLAGRADPAFLIARDPVRELGFAGASGNAFALRRRFGAWGLTGAIETGHADAADIGPLGALRYTIARHGYDRAAFTADRHVGPLALAWTASVLNEHGTVLGAHFGDGLGAARATSWFVDGEARLNPGGGWTIAGSVRHGWTLADVRAGLSGSGLIRTNAFAADVGKTGVFGAHDSLSIRVAQPLRVSHGGIDLDLPTSYDYWTARADGFTVQRLNLAPTGRELDVEMAYARPFGPGALDTHLYWRRDPGNIATLPNDFGWALRYSFLF